MLLLLCCMIPFVTACSKAINILLEEDDVTTETLAEETKNDVKKPENKALSESFSPSELFSTTLFKDDPALLQFTKRVEKQVAKFEQHFEVPYTGKLDFEDFEVQLNDLNSLITFVDPYTAGYFLTYEWTAWETDDGYLVELSIDYLTDAKKEQKVNQYVEEFADQYITKEMTDFERAKTINDYVVQLATYTEQGSTEGQSVFELISEETAVCQAYALLAYRLFLASDLDAKYVYGYSEDQLHAWNLVSIDDDWYHLDTTWNDVDPEEPYTVSYEYFLVNDEKLSQDHLWATENYFAATSDDYDFMHDMWYANTVDTVIYYNSLNDNKVYSYDVATNENKQITETACYYLATYSDSIYCSDYDNAGYLTKINVDDGSEEVLFEDEVLNLYIQDGILYYETLDGSQHQQKL
ncbi:transglutaminase domain-containing protein [Lysinibacillus cavernae]|uniref:transglutaminase domain-containing protein n=1 Tax=Lysinibacillus cavernae TaxID=2666135 RepID=UPI001E33753F|nr:transglutaminase domain-containing protein [Lysinibacillus cavernae]